MGNIGRNSTLHQFWNNKGVIRGAWSFFLENEHNEEALVQQLNTSASDIRKWAEESAANDSLPTTGTDYQSIRDQLLPGNESTESKLAVLEIPAIELITVFEPGGKKLFEEYVYSRVR